MTKKQENVTSMLFQQANLGDFSLVEPLQLSGSERRYFRVYSNDNSYILCFSENTEENHTFITLDCYFHSEGVRVPRILAVASDESAYLLQDLGSLQLLDLLHSGYCAPCELKRLIEETLTSLAQMQFLPESDWSEKVGFKPFDSELIKYDFNYSYSKFISRFDIEFDPQSLNSEFDSLESKILSFPSNLWGFMFRDFQSRNVMIHKDRTSMKVHPWFIDFQSGRKGPCIYDFVSFAWQARAGFKSSMRKEMLHIYADALKKQGLGNVKDVLNNYLPYFAAFRMLQVLGAYGLRGLTERKPHFIASIPPALKEFLGLLESTTLHKQFPTLYTIIRQLQNLHPCPA